MHQKWNLKNKFVNSKIGCTVDMIWGHDRYVKASSWSTVQSCNNGLTVVDDLGRKADNLWASKQICCKKRISIFFEKYRNLMFRSKISLWKVMESKEQSHNILGRCSLKYAFWKNEKVYAYVIKENSLKIASKLA